MEANNVDLREIRSFKDLKKSAYMNLKENDTSLNVSVLGLEFIFE